jgi:hypothetical protein
MDLFTVISIVVLLFVGFHDFFVNKLKFVKKNSEKTLLAKAVASDKNQKSSLSTGLKLYFTKKNLARGLLLIILTIVFKPILYFLNDPDWTSFYYSISSTFSLGFRFFLYAFALVLSLNFIFNELIDKSNGNIKEDVLTKLSHLEELYRKKLIDKDEYENRLESLKKEASNQKGL